MEDFFFLKDGDEYIKVLFSAILYVQASDKYSTFITTTRKILICQTLNNVERALPSKLFCRIHRSYIISLIHTNSFNRATVNIGKMKIPIGKQYRSVLLGRVTLFDEHKNFINLSDYDMLNV